MSLRSLYFDRNGKDADCEIPRGAAVSLETKGNKMVTKLTVAAAFLAATPFLALSVQADGTNTTNGANVVQSGEYHTTSDKPGVTDFQLSGRSNYDGLRNMWSDPQKSGVNAPHPVFIDMPTYTTVAVQAPAAIPAPSGNPYATTVLFDFDRSSLTTESMASLDTLIERLHSQGLTKVNVQGHTDSSGSNAYNQGLSQERATAVANYMTQKGIDEQLGSVVDTVASKPGAGPLETAGLFLLMTRASGIALSAGSWRA